MIVQRKVSFNPSFRTFDLAGLDAPGKRAARA